MRAPRFVYQFARATDVPRGCAPAYPNGAAVKIDSLAPNRE
jgi:hypothetical protein